MIVLFMINDSIVHLKIQIKQLEHQHQQQQQQFQ